MTVEQHSKHGVLRKLIVEADETELRQLILHVFAAIDTGKSTFRLGDKSKISVLQGGRDLMKSALLATVVVLALAGPTVAQTPDPLTCDGYAEPRTFVESQDWWFTLPGANGNDFGHAHLGACIPERETFSGAGTTIPLDIRLILHNNPARPSHTSLPYASVVVKGADYETTVKKLPDLGWSCPIGTCTRWHHYDLPISVFKHSGLQEVRFRWFIPEPDGNQMHTSVNWQLYVQNGTSTQNVTRRAYPRFKGWYTGAGYCESSQTSVPLPDRPLTAPWTPQMWMEWDGDSADLPPSRHIIALDPDAHADPPVQGTVLRQGSGSYVGPVTIDPATLAPGPHRLVARTECDDVEQGSVNAGVQVIRFEVPGDAPPPPPDNDVDDDGVVDLEDQCPSTPGPASNGGCPLPQPPTSFEAYVMSDSKFNVRDVPTGTTRVDYYVDGAFKCFDGSPSDFSEACTVAAGTHTLYAKALPSGTQSPPVQFSR